MVRSGYEEISYEVVDVGENAKGVLLRGRRERKEGCGHMAFASSRSLVMCHHRRYYALFPNPQPLCILKLYLKIHRVRFIAAILFYLCFSFFLQLICKHLLINNCIVS